jgi:hypothetical protein
MIPTFRLFLGLLDARLLGELIQTENKWNTRTFDIISNRSNLGSVLVNFAAAATQS